MQTLSATLTASLCCVVLAGCVSNDQAYQNRVATVSGDDASISYDGPLLRDARSVHLRYADLWQIEEIATFRSGDQVLQAWFTAAHSDQPVAMMLPYTVSDFVSKWSGLDGVAISDEAAKVYGLTGRTFQTRNFTAKGGQSCFAFATEYDRPSDDRQLRPGAGLYGYYCSGSPVALTDNDRLQILTGLWSPNRVPERSDLRGTGTPGALNAAREQLAEFPFTFGHAFAEGDGTRWD